ncbi:MAG: hypothetical protein ACI4VN_05875, partial [Clostridia bacterium]
MEEKNSIKINLSTIFLIMSLIIIIIMGFFIYKLYKDKHTADSTLADLNNEIARLQNDKQSSDNQLKVLNDRVAELQNIVDNFKNDN